MSDIGLYLNALLGALLLVLPYVVSRRFWIAVTVLFLADGVLVANLMYCRTYFTAIPPRQLSPRRKSLRLHRKRGRLDAMARHTDSAYHSCGLDNRTPHAATLPHGLHCATLSASQLQRSSQQ